MQKTKENKNNEAWIVSRKKLLIEFAVIIISAVLYSTAFPPLNWSFSAWFAILPLYFVISRKTPLKALGFGMLWGYIWATISFFWLREIEFFIPYGMAFILGAYPAVWACCVTIFRRHILIPVEIQLKGNEEEESFKPSYIREVLFILSITALWCLLEWNRSWIATGLPWNYAGASQWKNIPVIQVCEYTGVYGISFIIIFFNIALAFTVDAVRKSINLGKYRRPIPLVIALIFLMTAVLTGAKSMLKYRLAVKNKKETGKQEFVTLTAAVIQGNIPQCRFPKGGEAENALKQYLQLSELAILNKPDVVIWPETAVPYCYRSGHDFGDLYRFGLFKLLHRGQIPFLIGTIDYDFELLKEGVPPEEIPSHNSAFLLDYKSENLFNVVDKYHKIHLVPWGEYTPFGKYIPAIKKAFGMGRDLSPGKRYTIFELKPGVKAGVNICYEDVFPEISANFAKSGANLLVVLTNDAWYPKSSEAEQHLANAVFRSVETRLPMIRAGNNSCSCLILPNGVIADTVSIKQDGSIDPIGQSRGYSDFKIDIKKNPNLTFYTKYPNAFIWACSLIVLAASLNSLCSWREKKKFYTDKFKKD